MHSKTINEVYEKEKSLKPKNLGALRLEGHLNSPIIPDDIYFLLNNEVTNFVCSRHKKIRIKINQKEYHDIKCVYDACKSPWICLKKTLLLSKSYSNFITTNKVKEKYNNCVKFAIDNYILQKSILSNTQDIEDFSSLRQVLYHIISNDTVLFNSFKQKSYSEHIKNQFVKKSVPLGEFVQLSCGIEIEKELFIFQCHQHKRILGPTPLLLGVLDILQTRFGLFLYWRLSDFFKKYTDISMFESGLTLFNHIEDYQLLLGEDFFDFIKFWEPFTIAQVCMHNDDLQEHDLLNTISHELEQFPSFGGLKEAIINLWRVPTNSCDEFVHYKIEMSALVKSFGHPVIFDEKGIEKMQKIACEQTPYDMDISLGIRGEFIHLFCKGFFQKNRKWPKLHFISSPPVQISRAYGSNRWINSIEAKSLSSENWCCIEFEQNFNYDYSIDTAELLSDKSCAMPLPYWTQSYDPCATKILHNQRKPRLERQPTRVLLRYLKGHPNEVKEVVDEIEEDRYDPDNYIGILCRKERELKREGRLFVRLTYRARLEQTASESNIAKSIFPYIKQQTMSDSETGLAKKIGNFTKAQRDGNTEIINLDFSKWNMTQRASNNHAVAQELDNLFNLNNVYSRAHSRLQSNFLMGNSRLNPPEINERTGLPLPGDNCHTNQYGGLEGMRQKMWTLTTLCLIHYVANRLDLNINVLCQGDNVVILINWKPYQFSDKKVLRDRFIINLYQDFERIGLSIKKEETWVSQNLFEYGKSRWYKGVPVSNGSKRASRIISDENDGLSTFESGLSSISTATENIAKNDHSPDSAFLIYSFEIFAYLYRYNFPLDNIKELYSILYWPSILGGLPLSNLFSHSIRGHDDALTLWLSIYEGLKHSYNDVYQTLSKTIQVYKKSMISLKGLFLDIYSLNIVSLRVASLAAKEIVEEAILSYTTNEEVINLHLRSVQTNDSIVELLTNIRPIYAPLFSELLRNSNHGMYQQLKNRLLNVQTLMKLSEEIGEESPYEKIQSIDESTIKLLIKLCKQNDVEKNNNYSKNKWFFSHIDVNHNPRCNYVIARRIRLETWGIDIEGVSQPLPYEFGVLEPTVSVNDNDLNRCIKINTTQNYKSSFNRIKYFLGPRPIYHGSLTKVKSKTPLIKFDNPTPFIRTIKNIIDIKSWIKILDPDNCFQPIFDLLIQEKICVLPPNFDITTLEHIGHEVYGGSLQHRFHSINESRGALINCLNTITTHISFSTSGLDYYNSTGKDYPLFFQEIFLYIIYLLINNRLLYYGPDLPLSYMFRIFCDTCIYEYEDPQFQRLFNMLPIRININVRDNCPQTINLQTREIPPEYEISNNEGYSDDEIEVVMSLSAGATLGKYIDTSQIHLSYQRDLTGEAVLETTSFNVNLTEIKSCQLLSLLAGLCISSRMMRQDLEIVNSNRNYVRPNMCYTSIAQVIINAGRITELSETANTGQPASFRDTLTGGKNGAYIAMLIRRIYIIYQSYIFSLILSYQFYEYEHLEISTIPRWILRQVYTNYCKNQRIRYNTTICRLKELIKQRDETKSALYRLSDEVSFLMATGGRSIREKKNSHKSLITKLTETTNKIRDIHEEIEQDKLNNKMVDHEFIILNNTTLISLANVKSFIFKFNILPLIDLRRIFINDSDHFRQLWRVSKKVTGFSFLNNYSYIPVNYHPIKYSPDYITRGCSLDIIYDCFPVCVLLQSKILYEDPYVEILRHISSPLYRMTNSPSKIASILMRLDIDPKRIEEIVCLADGSFSLASYLIHLYPDSNITLNTLVTPETYPIIDIEHIYPPAFIGDVHINGNNLKDGVHTLLTSETDLTDINTLSKIEKLTNGINILTCDIDHVEDINTIQSCVYSNIGILRDNISDRYKILIFKINPDYDIIDLVLELFFIEGADKWTVFKPLQERMDNDSVYIIIFSSCIHHKFNHDTVNSSISDLIHLNLPTSYNVILPQCLKNCYQFKPLKLIFFEKYLSQILAERSNILNFSGKTIYQCYLPYIPGLLSKSDLQDSTICEIIINLVHMIVTSSWYDYEFGHLGHSTDITEQGKKVIVRRIFTIILTLVIVTKLITNSVNLYKWLHILATINIKIHRIYEDPNTHLISGILFNLEKTTISSDSVLHSYKTDIYTLFNYSYHFLHTTTPSCKKPFDSYCSHLKEPNISNLIMFKETSSSKTVYVTSYVIGIIHSFMGSIIGYYKENYP